MLDAKATSFDHASRRPSRRAIVWSLVLLTAAAVLRDRSSGAALLANIPEERLQLAPGLYGLDAVPSVSNVPCGCALSLLVCAGRYLGRRETGIGR
jgi:hypothetical protein